MPGQFSDEMGFVVPENTATYSAEPFLAMGLTPFIGGAMKNQQVTDALSQS